MFLFLQNLFFFLLYLFYITQNSLVKTILEGLRFLRLAGIYALSFIVPQT